jgi:hypothetical protein
VRRCPHQFCVGSILLEKALKPTNGR